jgi:16S rRNA (uracil1498-N3)-methyltransferase
MAERFFIEQDLKENEIIIIKEKEFHHLYNVMRKKVNDVIELINGKGVLGYGKIEKISKESATIFIEKVIEEKRLEKIILVQSFLRQNHLDFVIEKAVELGVFEIFLFKSKFSEKENFSEHSLNRLKNISISAIKQSKNLFLPSITIKDGLKDFKDLKGNKYFGDVREKAPFFLDVFNKNENIYFFVGPEKCFQKMKFFI